MWVALLQGILGILVVVEAENPALGGIIIGKSILDAILRYITTKPIG